MKMMGLSNWLHWLAWFVLYMLMMAVTVGIITFFLCIKMGEKGSVIDKSDPSVIFVFLMLYAASTIGFCFAVSVFFSKGKKLLVLHDISVWAPRVARYLSSPLFIFHKQ
jgi:ATP-binding cassette subfamily A (ABC1) protein 3